MKIGMTQNSVSKLNEVVTKLRLLWAVLALVLMAFIYWSSDRTWEGAAHSLPAGVSNLVHFPLYGCLAGLTYLALFGSQQERITWDIWLWVGVAGFGLLDEFHQSWVPGRDFSLWDVLTDGSGAVFATTCVDSLLRREYGRKPTLMGYSLIMGLLASFIFPWILPNF